MKQAGRPLPAEKGWDTKDFRETAISNDAITRGKKNDPAVLLQSIAEYIGRSAP
jgi:hypothetical protein